MYTDMSKLLFSIVENFSALIQPVRLGRGAYGTVYLCEDKKSGEQARRRWKLGVSHTASN